MAMVMVMNDGGDGRGHGHCHGHGHGQIQSKMGTGARVIDSGMNGDMVKESWGQMLPLVRLMMAWTASEA
eukprot:8704614-Lingulodinium_polyedra.AAC.1